MSGKFQYMDWFKNEYRFNPAFVTSLIYLYMHHISQSWSTLMPYFDRLIKSHYFFNLYDYHQNLDINEQ